ncbi:hypothetical protein [Paracoccus binzhouensis]|uniref:hypothetical protein n=1 Tax=Paracoccus binzhouensis TaxID=2796149 RepID=UPI0018EEDFB8|nr:hypothetical protein [Paracoccus binzhouensis]
MNMAMVAMPTIRRATARGQAVKLAMEAIEEIAAGGLARVQQRAGGGVDMRGVCHGPAAALGSTGIGPCPAATATRSSISTATKTRGPSG